MNPLGVGGGGGPGDQKLAFVPMDSENLPVSTLRVHVCVCVCMLWICKEVGVPLCMWRAVCMSECTWVIYVCTGVCAGVLVQRAG